MILTSYPFLSSYKMYSAIFIYLDKNKICANYMQILILRTNRRSVVTLKTLVRSIVVLWRAGHSPEKRADL